MKIKPQIRWVAVNPKGEIYGPCMKTVKEIKHFMIKGLSSILKTKAQWDDVVKRGYKIIECNIIPVDKEKEVEDKLSE